MGACSSCRRIALFMIKRAILEPVRLGFSGESETEVVQNGISSSKSSTPPIPGSGFDPEDGGA